MQTFKQILTDANEKYTTGISDELTDSKNFSNRNSVRDYNDIQSNGVRASIEGSRRYHIQKQQNI